MLRLFYSVLLATSCVSASHTNSKKHHSASTHLKSNKHEKRAARPIIGAYYAGYNQATLSPDQIDMETLTHLDFFVGETTSNYDINLSTTWNADAVIYQTVRRAQRARVLTSLVIGGWSGSRYFSSLVATPGRRNSYAQSLRSLIRKHRFAGIEIDWEYPGGAGIGNNENMRYDSVNFLAFLKHLRAILGPDYQISISVPASGFIDANGNQINDYRDWLEAVDYFKIMAYDLNGPWGGTTTSAPVAPMLQCYSGANPASVTGTVAYWKGAGVPGNQLILLMPAYGQSYTTRYPSLRRVKTVYGQDNWAFQPLRNTDSIVGNVTYNGLIGQGILNSDGSARWPYQRYFDDCTSTPFVYNEEKYSFITYDDPDSISIKAAFAKQQGLAGIGLFELSHDRNSALLKAGRAAFTSGTATRNVKRDVDSMERADRIEL